MKTLTTSTPSQLTQQTECISSKTALETSLTQFIRWVLRVTASGECSGDMALALLDQAWAAQKLLWSIRDLPTPSELWHSGRMKQVRLHSSVKHSVSTLVLRLRLR